MTAIIHPTLCIYHGNCADGFGAAMAIYASYGTSVRYHAGFYGQPLPSGAGHDVVFVDFSCKRAELVAMCAVAKTVTVIDHHKSTVEELAGLELPNLRVILDMERSGAMMTWEHFNQGLAEPPQLLHHIQDRDLWRFNLEGTREISAALFSYPYEFETWRKLMLPGMCSKLRAEGEAIERKHHKDIAELLKIGTRAMVIGGVSVLVANLPYIYSSDAGHVLSKDSPTFAACYWDTADARVFSLRSDKNGMDVSVIARKYGGGGHQHAAGFSAKIGWEGDEAA